MDISAVDMAWLEGWTQAENQVIMSFTTAPKPVEGWWLALFSWGDSAVLAWPVDIHNFCGGLQLITPRRSQHRWCFVPIIDVSNVMVAPMVWKSWAWQLRNVPAAAGWSPHVRMFKQANDSCTQMLFVWGVIWLFLI